MKTLIFLTLFISIAFVGFTQTTSIKIIDLSVIPLIMINQNPDSVHLSVDFKVKNINIAQKAIIKLGSEAENGSIINAELPIIQNNGIYSMNFNGKFFPVTNYQTRIIVPLTTEQYNNYNTVTVFVVANDGVETQHLYFNK